MARLIDADVIAERIIDELGCVLFGQSGAFDDLTGRQAANLIGKWIDEQPTIQPDAPRVMKMSEGYGSMRWSKREPTKKQREAAKWE